MSQTLGCLQQRNRGKADGGWVQLNVQRSEAIGQAALPLPSQGQVRQGTGWDPDPDRGTENAARGGLPAWHA